MKQVTFRNGDNVLVGNIYFPDDFDEKKPYAAIACIHPSGGVKEQTGAIYAERLAARGYLALTFDASFIGESGGEPRFLEEPATRVEDVRCAVDFLVTREYVDENRIGVLGIGAGGGYAVNAAMTEHRINAVGSVVPINIGRSRRSVAGSNDAVVKLLEEVGRQRTLEARGESLLIKHWLPNSHEELKKSGIADVDVREAVDYYTGRAPHGMLANNYCFRSLASMMGFDAFHLVEELLTQPLQVIVGDRVGRYGSFDEGRRLFERASCDKDLFVVAGASHYDLFDRLNIVEQAVARLAAFYDRTIGCELRD